MISFAGPKAGSLRWQDHCCAHSCPKPRCRVERTSRWQLIPVPTHTLQYTAVHFSDTPDLTLIIFRHPALPIYWGHRVQNRRPTSVAMRRCRRMAVRPLASKDSESSIATASTCFNCKFRGSQWVNGISFDLIFHHFPPSFSSTMKFDEFHVILFGLPKFGAGLAGV